MEKTLYHKKYTEQISEPTKVVLELLNTKFKAGGGRWKIMGFVDAKGSNLLKTSLSNALFFGERTYFVCFLLRTLMHTAVSFTVPGFWFMGLHLCFWRIIKPVMIKNSFIHLITVPCIPQHWSWTQQNWGDDWSDYMHRKKRRREEGRVSAIDNHSAGKEERRGNKGKRKKTARCCFRRGFGYLLLFLGCPLHASTRFCKSELFNATKMTETSFAFETFCNFIEGVLVINDTTPFKW